MHAETSRRHNKEERAQVLEKYTSHLFERVVCERELETEQNCNILTPTLMAITAFLSRSPGLLNRGPGGPASLGHGPHSSIFSPTDLRLWTPIAQSGVLRTPSAGCSFSLLHLIPKWLELPVHRVILLFYVHSIQPVDSQGYHLDTFNLKHQLFAQVHFLFWQLGPVRGQYTKVGWFVRSLGLGFMA